ncbi:hypothetical protein JD844_023662 [Phrynosoma platyrhinos]|uniref:Conserved oligomeric Golgi complex subunit 6 n=1 Tax=Phrynosoma platyrhinos TaxID=52577 RepID=A0ABQ7SX38_PHRPL|nr:hypothetical protein JD844_023662 [Phrynosoma platyrhinos]
MASASEEHQPPPPPPPRPLQPSGATGSPSPAAGASSSSSSAPGLSGGGGGPGPNPLSRKLRKVLETRLEADKELESINEDVQFMNNCCQEMTNHLKATKEQTQDLIVKTTKLQAENQRLELKAQIADAFIAEFQLSPEEMNILRSARDGPVTEDFFKVLGRVKQIHNDVKILLRTNQQRSGLEIMEQMALLQETSYEQLYRWAQGECRALTQESCDISPVLAQAMEALQDRPVLYKYTLDEFATARRSAVVRGFIDALTRGGPGGTPRPIEMHSHDPLRYVGDMLAWLHQATASEKEHLEALLKYMTTEGVEENMQEVIGHITEGVRIEQVIVGEPGAVLLYKISNLLKFYHHTISNIVGSSAAVLLTTIEEMHLLSKKIFFNSLSLHASKLMDKIELPPADLGPSSALNQTLALLREVLASHDSCVIPLDTRQADFVQVLSCVLDPLLQMCTVSASNLGSADMATFMVNSLHMMKTTLALFEFTDKRLEMLQYQIEAHLDTLINEQASYVLTRVGLSSIYNVVQQHKPEQGPLANIPSMDAMSLKAAMVQFDRYLSAPDGLLMPQINFLLSTAVKQQIIKLSTELVCRAYSEVYAAVMNPDNKYKDPETILHRSPHQVQALLS